MGASSVCREYLPPGVWNGDLDALKAFYADAIRPHLILRLERRRNVLYAACKAPSGEVWGLAIQTWKQGREYVYRMDEETSGPYLYGASPQLISLLTPTDRPHALQWRRKCCGTRGAQVTPMVQGVLL
jgi:hypothetical protein